MGDPAATHSFTIGGKVREFKWSFLAMRIIQKRFDGKTVFEVLQKLDIDTVCEIAAAGLAGAGDRKASAERVCDWLEAAPELFVDLASLCSVGVIDSYKRILPKEEQNELGEALAAVGAAAETAKRATSTPAVATASVPVPPPLPSPSVETSPMMPPPMVGPTSAA